MGWKTDQNDNWVSKVAPMTEPAKDAGGGRCFEHRLAPHIFSATKKTKYPTSKTDNESLRSGQALSKQEWCKEVRTMELTSLTLTVYWFSLWCNVYVVSTDLCDVVMDVLNKLLLPHWSTWHINFCDWCCNHSESNLIVGYAFAYRFRSSCQVCDQR